MYRDILPEHIFRIAVRDMPLTEIRIYGKGIALRRTHKNKFVVYSGDIRICIGDCKTEVRIIVQQVVDTIRNWQMPIQPMLPRFEAA